MSHVENLVMNEIRKALENLSKSGVGCIDVENAGNLQYDIDDKIISITVKQIQ